MADQTREAARKIDQGSYAAAEEELKRQDAANKDKRAADERKMKEEREASQDISFGGADHVNNPNAINATRRAPAPPAPAPAPITPPPPMPRSSGNADMIPDMTRMDPSVIGQTPPAPAPEEKVAANPPQKDFQKDLDANKMLAELTKQLFAKHPWMDPKHVLDDFNKAGTFDAALRTLFADMLGAAIQAPLVIGEAVHGASKYMQEFEKEAAKKYNQQVLKDKGLNEQSAYAAIYSSLIQMGDEVENILKDNPDLAKKAGLEYNADGTLSKGQKAKLVDTYLTDRFVELFEYSPLSFQFEDMQKEVKDIRDRKKNNPQRAELVASMSGKKPKIPTYDEIIRGSLRDSTKGAIGLTGGNGMTGLKAEVGTALSGLSAVRTEGIRIDQNRTAVQNLNMANRGVDVPTGYRSRSERSA